jgi:hypothetical protein
LVCLFLHLTGLDRFVAASYGAQQQVNRRVEEAMVAYRQDETARLAQAMPRTAITITQDETFPGGLCLVTRDPESHFILLEQLAQARDHASGDALMAPALAPLNCQVMQSTSDAAPGLLAYVEHSLEAHHSPDLCHVPHALVKAVSGPLATKERAAHKALGEAREQLKQGQAPSQSAVDGPPKRPPGRPPQAPGSLEQAEQARDAACREHERLAQQRQQVKARIRALSHAYHFVDLARGVRRNGHLMASESHEPIEQVRAVARHAGLSQSCLERMEKAERVVPKMQATIAFVAGDGRQQVAQLDLTPPASFAMHAKLMPPIISLVWPNSDRP